MAVKFNKPSPPPKAIEAPTHTDLMVPPETIGPYLDANPLEEVKNFGVQAEAAAVISANEDGHFISTTPVLYSQSQQMHGFTSKGVLIPDELHASRLERAADFIKGMTPKGCSILDVGCGYGALWPLIEGHGASYLGIDPSKAFIDHAQAIHGKSGSNPSFAIADIATFDPTVDAWDYVVCLGLATHLKAGQEHLDWLASQLQTFAHKGIIIEVQGIEYKGQFTKHTIEEVTRAFCQRPRSENILTDPKDTAVTYFLRLA